MDHDLQALKNPAPRKGHKLCPSKVSRGGGLLGWMARCFQHAAMKTWLECSQSWVAKTKRRGRNKRKGKSQTCESVFAETLGNMRSERGEVVEIQMGSFLKGLSELNQAFPCYLCLDVRGPKWCVKLNISHPILLTISTPLSPSPDC